MSTSLRFNARRRIDSLHIGLVLVACVCICWPTVAYAQNMSADVWVGDDNCDFNSDSGTCQMPLYGRSVGDDPSGEDVMLLYAQLIQPSGSYLDSGTDSGYHSAEINLFATLNAWNMQSGEYNTSAQMYYGGPFFGCTQSTIGLSSHLFSLEKTAGCGSPINYFTNRCPNTPCSYSGCALSSAPWRGCVAIRVTTGFSWCTPPGCTPASSFEGCS